MVYESLLLVGVIFIAILIFFLLFQRVEITLSYRHYLLQGWLFIVIGSYFVWFWSAGRQTLAMKTWRIQIVTDTGEPLDWQRALTRYLLAWMWIVPGLFAAWFLEAKTWMLILIPALNIVLWALVAFADPQRQFPHDRLAGTRQINRPG